MRAGISQGEITGDFFGGEQVCFQTKPATKRDLLINPIAAGTW